VLRTVGNEEEEGEIKDKKKKYRMDEKRTLTKR
jgi:hypothetical protein